MASITLLGLENDLADELRRILEGQGHDISLTNSICAPILREADILFVAGDGPDYRELVRYLTEEYPDIPLVLVNRHPENGRWLDALELGAADYCGAPFEPRQVRWVVDSVTRRAVA